MSHTHVQDRQHSHNTHDHSFSNKRKLILVIIFNLGITITEYIGGLLSGSLALISDAGHNLSDVLSLILGYAGEKVSEKKPTKRYTFGFKRFEVLIALINSLSLIVIGIYILYESFVRYLHPVAIHISIMLPVAAVGLVGNIMSIVVLFSNKNTNLNMKAAFLHLLYDTFSSVIVIIAGVIIYVTNWYIIDILMSILIVIMIFISSSSIIIESFRIFLQGVPDNIDSDSVYNDIIHIKDVISLHDLHIWSVNSNEIFFSCHIRATSSLDQEGSNRLLKSINEMLKDKYNINHSTLQIETNDECDTGNCN